MRQMADRFIAQHYSPIVLVHRVVKLLFSNEQAFLQSMAFIYLDKHDIHAQLMQKRTFPCSPALYFCSNSIIVISIVGLSSEDNCCQSEETGE